MPAKFNPDRLALLDDLAAKTPLEAPELSAGPEGAWSWECDALGNYTRCGDEVMQELGIPSSEFMGKSIFTFQVDAETTKQLQEIHKRGTYPKQITAHFLSLNGNIIWVRMHIHADTLASATEPVWFGFNLVMQTPEAAEASPPLLDPAIRLLKEGRIIEGRRMIQKYLDRFPDDEQAWIWFADTFPGVDQRLHILELFVEHHPGRETALRAIEVLQVKRRKQVELRQAAFRAVPTIPVTRFNQKTIPRSQLRPQPEPEPEPESDRLNLTILILGLVIIAITIAIAAAVVFLI
jgi:hypothetical protein